MRTTILLGVLLTPVLAAAQVRLPRGEEKVNRASALIVRGDYKGAEPLLRQAVVDAPNDPYAYFNLASVERAGGRYEEAAASYQKAQALFETKGGANGSGDVAGCLYGIALAREGAGDPTAAAQAWNDYIRYAQRFANEQPAVAIARVHVDMDRQLAQTTEPIGGTQEATRPHTTR
jgi:tetratricopeptide (TPR) repeat protein